MDYFHLAGLFPSTLLWAL